AALMRRLPGLRHGVVAVGAEALRRRPPLGRFPPHRLDLETWYRGLLTATRDEHLAALGVPASAGPDQWAARATELAERHGDKFGSEGLLKDWWTGDWPQQEGGTSVFDAGEAGAAAADDRPARSARLSRRPTIREAGEDE